MTIDVDIQLACHDQFSPSAQAMLETNIAAWVTETLLFPGVMWLRASPWEAAETFAQSAQLTVRIVGLEEGVELNQTYRQGDGATNVLSFPFDEAFQVEPPLLGDIVICAPVIDVEARDQGKSLDAHWAHMIVHGVLHLLGYDHFDDEQASQMETLEVQIVQHFGFANPYREQEIVG